MMRITTTALALAALFALTSCCGGAQEKKAEHPKATAERHGRGRAIEPGDPAPRAGRYALPSAEELERGFMLDGDLYRGEVIVYRNRTFIGSTGAESEIGRDRRDDPGRDDELLREVARKNNLRAWPEAPKSEEKPLPMDKKPDIKTEDVEYKIGDTTCLGFVAWDANIKGKRPGVLIVHAWRGLDTTGKAPHEQDSAKKLAALGYVAFCADIYGKGVRPKDGKEASAEATKYRTDTALFRARLTGALDKLKSMDTVDPLKTAAMGYCFGGGGALELARSGASVLGVVSFHGALSTKGSLADEKTLKAKILVCHGADDGFENGNIEKFQTEMKTAKADWQFISYGNAVHSFTDPYAGNQPSTGVAYNEKAATRSWQAMTDFFRELFGK
jgi:dienelactone hydrolase